MAGSAIAERHTTKKSAAPDWALVPFEVGCARCGHDLRGLSEPTCPACELAFEWTQAVPIEQLTCAKCGYHLYGLKETRCPECGERFTWEEVLDDYHRRRKPLFEYHWRTRPVRSFVATLWLSLRPWKLWRLIDIHDPPAIRGLTLLLLVSCAISGLGVIGVVILGSALLEAIANYYWSLGRSVGWGARTIVGPGGFGGTGMLGSVAAGAIPWGLLVVCTGIATLTMLLMLRQSMAHCKVRNLHVVRAWVYALVPILFTPLLAAALGASWDSGSLALGHSGHWFDAIESTIVMAGTFSPWAWMFLSLGFAYRRYIRMRHAWGVVLASQALAFLFALLVGTLVARLQM